MLGGQQEALAIAFEHVITFFPGRLWLEDTLVATPDQRIQDKMNEIAPAHSGQCSDTCGRLFAR